MIWPPDHGHDIHCAWTLVTGPVGEPLTVDEVKQQMRILDNASDALIAGYITAARETAEQYMGRGLLTQTWKMTLRAFANTIYLPMASPLQSVTSITYYDSDGVQQTLATSVYDVDTVCRPGAVVLKPDQIWPAVQTLNRKGAIEITYVVGWTDADSVPQRIKQGMAQYVTYLDQDRDGMDAAALQAQQAAERCWSDRIEWTPPRWGTY